MSRPASLLILLPSLRISGGVAEALKLAREVQACGVNVQVISFWKHAHELDTSAFRVTHLLNVGPDRSSALHQLPLLTFRFMRFVRHWKREQPGTVALLLTHFTTFFYAWLFPWVPRVCFNQDEEWLFVGKGWRRSLLKWLIIFTSQRSIVITANKYISSQFEQNRVRVFGEASIWADSQWLAEDATSNRPIDVAMLLRLSPFKRLDLHLALLHLLDATPGIHTAVITPEESIAEMLASRTDPAILRPSNEELKKLFGATRLFVLLSDVEGFGLPPLEAMGSGAVPLCRDSGGVRNYLYGRFEGSLIPMSESIESIYGRIVRMLQEFAPSPSEAQISFAEGLDLSLKTRRRTIDRLSATLKGISLTQESGAMKQ